MFTIFFARYRRIISLVIVVLLALLISKIYFDATKSWQEKLFSGDIKVKYGESEVTIGKYVSYLKSLEGAKDVYYSELDISSDGKEDIVIMYYEKESVNYAILQNCDSPRVYEIGSSVSLESLKQNGILKKKDDQYGVISFGPGSVFINLVFYKNEGKYYYQNKEVSKEIYEEEVKKYEDSKPLNYVKFK